MDDSSRPAANAEFSPPANSAALLFAILESLPFRVYAYDANARCILQNQVSIRDFGSLVGRTIDEHPSPRAVVARWIEEARQALAGAVVWAEQELPIRGETRAYRYSIAPIRVAGTIRGVVGLDIDITDQRRTEIALRESEERFRQLTETLRLVMWEADAATWQLLYIGPQATTVFGYPRERWLEADFWIDHVVPEDRKRVVQEQMQQIASADHFDLQYRFRAADGTVVWVEDSVTVLRHEGRPVRLRGFMLDISRRKRAEEALRESEARYRLLADHSTDVITRHAPSGEWLYASPAAHTVLGYEPANLIGRNPFEMIHPDDRERIIAQWQEMQRTGMPQTGTMRVRRADNRYIWMEAAGRALANPATGKAAEFIVTSRDVTERIEAHQKLREREAELTHLDRLSTMGQMASELAHELSQPLYAITNFADACLGLVDRPGEISREELRRWLTQIAQQARRGGDVLRRITHFVRKGELRRQTIDLNQTIRDVLAMLEFELRRHVIEVQFEPSAGALWVHADPLLMEQVLANLIRNAEEAMETAAAGQRVLTVKSYSTSASEVGVAVSDTGPGFPEGTNLFESYFTTKPHGTGLGLPICRSTIEAHHGRIWATNNPQRGATFQFVLPAASPSDLSARSTSAA